MNNINQYDFIFTGLGASTCVLLREMNKRDLLENKNILIIDPSRKNENDKTFCFWAKKTDDIYIEYQDIISNQWDSIQINDFKPESIYPLNYFHINSIDLYKSAHKIIEEKNISYIKGKVTEIKEKRLSEVITNEKSYFSKKIFDCRPINIAKLAENKKLIYQSFIGFKVKLNSKKFDAKTFKMMDFRIDQNHGTQFIYILPYNSNYGLIELTRFGDDIINKKNSEVLLDKYINKNFGKYELIDKEVGLIPMSSENIINKKKKIIEIGTRAGNIKPSTGYGFKKMYSHSKNICDRGIKQTYIKTKNKFILYDELLLIILKKWPEHGKSVFSRLFKSSEPKVILKFLDEQTNIKEDFKIFSRLQIMLFFKSLIIWISRKIKKSIIPIVLIVLTLFPSTTQESVFLNETQLLFISLGLLLVGIPHGALDYFTGFYRSSKKTSFSFIIYYILLMIPIFLLWLSYPSLSLILFILYSSWHFGQTDMKFWKINSSLMSLFWGLTIFLYLFSSHETEFIDILRIIGINQDIKTNSLLYTSNASLFLVSIYSLFKRKISWLLMCLFLFFSSSLSLVYAFSLYFIFHHSIIGWFDIKKSSKLSHLKLYTKAIPFNIGAIFIFYFLFITNESNYNEIISWFFVFLSCISFPHILSMNFFYKKIK